LTRETQATELQGQGAACLSSQLFIERLPEESNSAPLRDIATDDPGAVDQLITYGVQILKDHISKVISDNVPKVRCLLFVSV
jgi:hypothetical protein